MKNKKGNVVFGIVALVAISAAIFISMNNVERELPGELVGPTGPIGSETETQPIESDYEGGAIRSGYLSQMRTRSQLITSYKDFEEYCQKYNDYAYDGQGNVIKSTGKLNSLVEKYDKKYFEEKSLALVYVELSSGSDSVEFIAATKDGNSATIMYKIKYPEGGIGTCDMSGYIVYVEVDKDITNIITY